MKSEKNSNISYLELKGHLYVLPNQIPDLKYNLKIKIIGKRLEKVISKMPKCVKELKQNKKYKCVSPAL